VLNSFADQAREPLETKYGFCHVFTRYDIKCAYGAGADVSQGLGQDYHSVVILAKQGGICTDAAYIHVNDISLDTYARYTYDFCSEYNFPLLVGESNSMGLNYLQKLQELRYPRLFMRGDSQDIVGWYTQEKNKESAMIDLQQAIDTGTLIIRYKPVLQQLTEVQRVPSKTGEMKIKSTGKHDDLVMGLALAYQATKNVIPKGKGSKPLVTRRVMQGMYK